MPLLATADILGTWELLEELQGDDLRAAKAWFRSNRFQIDDLDLPFAGDHETQFDTRNNAHWVQALCAIRLCAPVEAARRVPWPNLLYFRDAEGEPAFVHQLWDTDRAWVAEFVTAASAVSTSGLNLGWETLSRVLRVVVIHHDLPCPSGAAFMGEWLAGVPGNSLVEKLQGNPLMPDLLWYRLASGDCGSTSNLPEAISELVDLGELDRAAVLDQVFALLAAPQRPASQRTLAQITRSLALRPDEIPGGLTYLLGVISTSHGSAGKILLPHAIALVVDGDDLAELTTVVASRPEKKQKEMLLSALGSREFQERVGTPAAVSAAALIAETDDAVIAERAARLAERLDETFTQLAADPAPTGLWELKPQPTGQWRNAPSWATTGWAETLNVWPEHTYKITDDDLNLAVDHTLLAMQQGQFGDGAMLIDPASRLLNESRLAINRLTRMVPDLFLAGGLQQGWPALLEVADRCCAHSPRPLGLADLLRTLGLFADQVPSQELPLHIRDLARTPGKAKMQVEARLLGARLAHLTVPEYLQQLPAKTAAEPSRDAPRPLRGLWSATVDIDPLPGRIPAGPAPQSLAELRTALEQDFSDGGQDGTRIFAPRRGYMNYTNKADLSTPDVVLAATVEAINLHGPDAVRAALRGISREVTLWEGSDPSPQPPVGIIYAVDLWVQGRLEPGILEIIARMSVVRSDVFDQLRNRAWLHPAEIHDLVRDTMPSMDNGLPVDADHPLIRPEQIASAAAALGFLRASESLLLAEVNPVVLCAPTWEDGTLDVETLRERIVKADKLPTSPLDLLQALWRLRPCDASAADSLTELSLPLASSYTMPDGSHVTDGVDLVRSWLAAGGLPPLDAYEQDGQWHTDARAPLPWAGCQYAPSELAVDPWYWGDASDVLRVMPWWPDRVIPHPGMDGIQDMPVRVSGTPGLPIHYLLWKSSSEAVAEMARRNRFDPELVARAAVLRHSRGELHLGYFVRFLRSRLRAKGCLAGIWPSALAIADGLVGVAKKPSQLPQLLSLLIEYAPEVPEPVIPEGLRRFAAGKGTTKSHIEARRLIEALDR